MTSASAKHVANSGQFGARPRPANSGRKPGKLNQTTIEARETARMLTGSAVYLERLKRRLESGQLSPAMETTLWYYAYGKPKESTAVSGTVKHLFEWANPNA